MPGNQKAIVIALARMTYGYNKTRDRVSMRQLARMVGCNEKNVRRSLADLVARGIVIDHTPDDSGRPHDLQIQKDFDQWGERHKSAGRVASLNPTAGPKARANGPAVLVPTAGNGARSLGKATAGIPDPTAGPNVRTTAGPNVRHQRQKDNTKDKEPEFTFPQPIPEEWVSDIAAYLSERGVSRAVVRRKAAFALEAAGESEKAADGRARKTSRGWLAFTKRGIRHGYFLKGWDDANARHFAAARASPSEPAQVVMHPNFAEAEPL